MAKHSLYMRCPHCGELTSCSAEKVESLNQNRRDPLVRLFKEFVGNELFFRGRQRCCNGCVETFRTAELSYDFLDGLVKDRNRLEKENAQLRDDAEDARAREGSLGDVLQRIAFIATTKMSRNVELLAIGGKRNHAIIAHIAKTGCSLAEAKNAVNAFIASSSAPAENDGSLEACDGEKMAKTDVLQGSCLPQNDGRSEPTQ